ncbi:hypothetical protein ACM614_02220 [Streptomyces sp. 12297]
MRYECAARTDVGALALQALDPPGEMQGLLEEIERWPECPLVEGHGGHHFGLVRWLEHREAGLWTSWRDGVRPTALLALEDCSVWEGEDVCSGFRGHAGEHTWALRARDSADEAVAASRPAG